ncbi:Hypothetical protein EIN_347580, partial [Entamoeba invadens IP1]
MEELNETQKNKTGLKHILYSFIINCQQTKRVEQSKRQFVLKHLNKNKLIWVYKRFYQLDYHSMRTLIFLSFTVFTAFSNECKPPVKNCQSCMMDDPTKCERCNG